MAARKWFIFFHRITDEIDREIVSKEETIRSIREIVVATRVETSRLFLATVYPLIGVNLSSTLHSR